MTSTLFWCSASYKVKSFLVLLLIRYDFLAGRKHTCFKRSLLKVNCEYDRRNCGICSKLTVKMLERSQLTSFFNQTQKQPPVVFYKRAVLKNFAIFTGKRLCLSLFLKVLGLQLYGKRLQHKCFSVNIGKILGTRILNNIYQRLLL